MPTICRLLCACAALTAAMPAYAASVLLPFASFTTQPGGTFYWQNNVAYGGNGSGGQIFTTTTPSTPTPGFIPILFTWAANGIVNAPGTLIFRGIAINSPAVVSGPTFQVVQSNIGAGSFNILLGVTPILNGTYNSAFIVSNLNATNATLITNSFPGGLVITSPIFPVAPGFFLSLNKTGVAPPISIAPGGALADFDPAVEGVFSNVVAVPEPGTWALLIAGFGLTGAALRRRRAAALA